MSGPGLDDVMSNDGASELQITRPDSKQKKRVNGLYKRLAEAARRKFIHSSNCREDGPELMLNLERAAIGSLCQSRGETLKLLGLSRCQLRLLPDFASRLANLESLQLQHNHLKTLPDWMGSLAKLKYLDISGHLLRFLPDSIGNCGSLLEYANLNQLECLPSTFGKLGKLKQLHIHINQLKNLPPSCSNLKSLKYLDLRFNNLREANLQPFDFQCIEMEGLPDFCDVGCSSMFDDQDEPQSFSARITIYSYIGNSNQARELSKCFDGRLTNTSIILLDGNPVIVPPMASLYVAGIATLERFGKERTNFPPA